MRENTKIILWVVVAAFLITIFAVWGLDLQSNGLKQQESLAGRVNGVPVTPQSYQQVYTQMAQQMRGQGGSELSSIQQEIARDQAWENIVSSIITSAEIKRLGIGVTDEEILGFLRTSPPPEVQQYFRDKEGKFDYAAYQTALNNPDADWSAVEDLARQRIPVVKLNEYLTAQIHVSAGEVRRAFEEQNVKMTAEYVAFPLGAENIGDFAPSDAEVKAYYDAHPDLYKDVEKAVLEYVRIPIAPTGSDREDLMLSARQIRDEAAAGDFAGTATTYSEGQTATVGGETGLIDRTQRDEAVMKVVDTLKPGAVSEPIATADGVYIVQLIETKKEKGQTKYNLREIFMKLTAGSATVDSLTALAQDVQRAAAEAGDLAAAATAKGLKTQTTAPFGQGPVPGLGFVPALSRFAFAGEPGRVGNVISDDHNFYVARVVSRTPAGTKPLAEVADGIKQELVRQRRLVMADHKADAFRKSAVNPNLSFAKAAAQYGYSVARTDSFTVAAPPAQTGSFGEFARAALASNPGEVVGPIESGDAVYVLRVLGRRDPNDAVFKGKANALLAELRDRKIQEYVSYWYQDLKGRSTIEDLRSSY